MNCTYGGVGSCGFKPSLQRGGVQVSQSYEGRAACTTLCHFCSGDYTDYTLVSCESEDIRSAVMTVTR